MTEQPDTPTHCFMCGHPVDSHDPDADGNRPCRSPGHPKGVPCSGCRALLTTEYRERVQDVREKPGFEEAWNAFLITRDDAQHQFGEHAPVYFTDIHQSALASALIHYRQTLEGAAPTEAPAGIPESFSDASDQAWGAVWLHGNWRYLTQQMTTEARELAAAAVMRWMHGLDVVNGDPARPEPEELRWWRG